MEYRLFVVCVLSGLLFTSVAGARELSPACQAEKESLESQAKVAYQRWDTSLYNELNDKIRQVERFCTDEKLLENIETRLARQKKKIFSLQQSLEDGSDKKRGPQWLEKQGEQLRKAQETLQSIEAEKRALEVSMGLVPAGQQEAPSILEEPLAVDTPAYSK